MFEKCFNSDYGSIIFFLYPPQWKSFSFWNVWNLSTNFMHFLAAKSKLEETPPNQFCSPKLLYGTSNLLLIWCFRNGYFLHSNWIIWIGVHKFNHQSFFNTIERDGGNISANEKGTIGWFCSSMTLQIGIVLLEADS